MRRPQKPDLLPNDRVLARKKLGQLLMLSMMQDHMQEFQLEFPIGTVVAQLTVKVVDDEATSNGEQK